jgi:hypothetical protein
MYHAKLALTAFKQCGGPGTLWAKVQPFLIVAPCVIALSWVALFFWIKQLYGEFGFVRCLVLLLYLTFRLVGLSSTS